MNCPAITVVLAPQLTHVAGSFDFRFTSTLFNINYNSSYENSVLTGIYLPSVTFIDTYVSVRTNLALAVLDFTSLGAVGTFLDVRSNPMLTYIYAPQLTFVGTIFRVCSNSPSITLPSWVLSNAPNCELRTESCTFISTSCPV